MKLERWTFAICVLLALTVAGSSAAATKSMAWKKIAAAYTTQAKAHGYTVNCTPWNRVVAMNCALTRGSTSVLVSPTWRADGCTVTIGTHAVGQRAQQVDVDTCRKAWWLTPLPAPWTAA